MFRLSQGLISCRHIEIKLNQYISNLLVVLYWWCSPTEVSLWLVVSSVLIGVVKNELVIYNFSLTCCRTCDSFTDCTDCGCLDLVAINTLLLTLLKKNSFFSFVKEQYEFCYDTLVEYIEADCSLHLVWSDTRCHWIEEKKKALESKLALKVMQG